MKVNEDIENPNGIQLSRDEKTLYVANTRGEYMLAFDIQPDGKLTNSGTSPQYQGVTKNDTGVTSGADGIAIDNDGRVYAAINSTGGVQVFSPEGKYPGHDSNFTWRAEHRVRRSRQEDAVHRRQRGGFQGADAVAGIYRPRRIALAHICNQEATLNKKMLAMVLLLAVAAFTLPVKGQGGEANYKPKRLDKMIELLEAGRPIYDISVEGVGYEEGKKLSQDRYDLIQYQMEHGVFDPHMLRQFMQGLVDGGPTKSGHRTPTVIVTLPVLGLDEDDGQEQSLGDRTDPDLGRAWSDVVPRSHS